jgi:cytochrome c oxidase cbb3-type subunit III
MAMFLAGTRGVPGGSCLFAAKISLALMAPFLAGCDREQRQLRLDPPIAHALDQVAAMPSGIGGAPPQVYSALEKPYVSNAYDLSQGKRLYAWFGCPECHGGDGLGGAGPPLLDGWWQYGPDVVSIYMSIRDGRSGGMPAFRDKLNNEQIWQLTGYVQTMGAYVAKTAAPSRDDAVQSRPAENRAPAAILFDQFPQIR